MSGESGADFQWLAEAQDALNVTFKRPGLLARALTHKSWSNERNARDSHYERLEFLGDAVLGLCVAEELFVARPDAPEGDLAPLRSQLVSTQNLAKVSLALGLGRWVRLSEGEERSGARTRPSMLADLFEAALGAVYLDAGLEKARSLVRQFVTVDAASVSARPTRENDPKSALQQWTQAELATLPEYKVVGEHGPPHAPVFEIAVEIDGREVGRGSASRKQKAEKIAASAALQALTQGQSGNKSPQR
jgi:ribonuclease-3